MQGVFVELPAFERHRSSFLDDDAFLALQNLLMQHPEAGDPIPDTGKRGGLRVIYYWWVTGLQFWLFTIYDKDEMADLTPQQCKALKALIKAELRARRSV